MDETENIKKKAEKLKFLYAKMNELAKEHNCEFHKSFEDKGNLLAGKFYFENLHRINREAQLFMNEIDKLKEPIKNFVYITNYENEKK